jgi:hypothetical protein
MVLELHEALLARSDAPAVNHSPDPAHDHTTTNGQAYVSLAGSETYHRADCAMVASKANAAKVAPSTIRRRQLTPCSLCEPALVDAP